MQLRNKPVVKGAEPGFGGFLRRYGLSGRLKTAFSVMAARFAASRLVPGAMKSGLQRRLLLLLLLPLGIYALTSIYFDYRTASNVALQKDEHLLRLISLLADSVIAPSPGPGEPPLLLMLPEVASFLRDHPNTAGFRMSRLDGEFVAGDAWLSPMVPSTHEPEFYSTEDDGVTYRVAAQRVKTVAGELVMQLADGSDARQQWVRSILFKVLLPNLILVIVAGFAVNWAVTRALKPLLDLKDAVERRSPRDLSAIDAQAIPVEVQPLVTALNRLFGLVNDQAEGQRRFVADAAHQLRTPLAGLQAQVEAWAQAAKTAKAKGEDGAVTLPADKILRLRSATRRTSQLANQLLALSRADASATSAQPMQRVDLKNLCESILALHLDAATAKGIDLGLEVQPVQTSGYEWLLRELLGNLVDNAVKYTPPGGTVTIRCGPLAGEPGGDAALAALRASADQTLERPERRGAFLEVEDDGPGIAPEERPKALQRFYRVLGTVGEGNGLGLAIADEIARVHHCQLELSSAINGAGGSRGLRIRLALQL
jgi:two-component system sensor histidine kinase TctE